MFELIAKKIFEIYGEKLIAVLEPLVIGSKNHLVNGVDQGAVAGKALEELKSALGK